MHITSCINAIRLPLAILLFFLSHAIHLVDAATRRPHEIRPGRFEDVDRFDEVYMIVRNTFLMACAPVVFTFLYSVYRDPATPILIKALCRRLKRRLLTNLSDKGLKD
jgi:hypothetical protein